MDYFKELETNLAYHFSEVLEEPLAKPYWIYISLSHKCTYNCQMCGVVRILKNYELSLDTVKKSFNEISQWGREHTIMLTGGEPFLRKDIFDLIDFGLSKNLCLEVVSNGSLINNGLAEKVILSGLNNIAISLDGAKECTHDKIRQKGSFQQASRAIKSLVEAKKALGKGPQISVWTTIMKENVSELFDIIALVKDLGVECLVYHPVIVAQEDMQNTQTDAGFWIKGNDLEVLKSQIDKIIAYKKKYGLVSFLHDPYLWVKHFKGEVTKQDWKCNPFVFINIGPDAEVRSCGSAFGNLNTMNLAECLQTKEADRARKLMKSCSKLCLQTCWAHPESDSLRLIVDSFILKVRRSNLNRENKKKVIQEALKILAGYEHKLREKNG